MAPRPSSDPTIRCTVMMPASVYQRLRQHADETATTISKQLREAALRIVGEFNDEAAP